MSASSQFDDISPEVGALDESAFDEAMEVDPDAALALLADMTTATDDGLRALAKRLAARLFVDLARREAPSRRGIGRIASTRYRPDAGDIDIERSLDELVSARAQRRAVEPDDLMVRTWAKPTTAICVLVDRSGSMYGAALATAALAAAAVAARCEEQPDHELAVLSFGSDVVAARAIWETRSADEVVDRVLALRGHGTTDVAGALRAAGAQLSVVPSARRLTVLLSDCRATEPGDVIAAARSLDELVIVAPAGDADDAARLAGAVGARWTTVTGPSAVVSALRRVLDRDPD